MRDGVWLGSCVGLLFALAGAGSCGTRAAAEGPVAPPLPPDPAASPPLPAAPAASTAGDVATATPAIAPSFSTIEVGFARELSQPLRSIAIGQRRVAALADVPYLREQDGQWRPIPLPPPLDHGPHQELTIYMGRDDRPRLMGYSWEGEPSARAERRPIYLRYLARGWTPAWDELGRLGGTRPGALFGVLGYDDPEVVCKEDEGCLVKRRSGWTAIGTTDLGPVRLAGRGVFGLPAKGLTRLTERGFVDAPVALPAGTVRDLWEIGPGELWVILVRDGRAELVHVRESTTETVLTPITGPRALWATGARDLWLAGDDGLAWFDGERWHRVLGAEPPLSCLVGRGTDVLWAGGARGLFRRLTHPGATPPPG